jgi:hypothetical protein
MWMRPSRRREAALATARTIAIVQRRPSADARG